MSAVLASFSSSSDYLNIVLFYLEMRFSDSMFTYAVCHITYCTCPVQCFWSSGPLVI